MITNEHKLFINSYSDSASNHLTDSWKMKFNELYLVLRSGHTSFRKSCLKKQALSEITERMSAYLMLVFGGNISQVDIRPTTAITEHEVRLPLRVSLIPMCSHVLFECCAAQKT